MNQKVKVGIIGFGRMGGFYGSPDKPQGEAVRKPNNGVFHTLSTRERVCLVLTGNSFLCYFMKPTS